MNERNERKQKQILFFFLDNYNYSKNFYLSIGIFTITFTVVDVFFLIIKKNFLKKINKKTFFLSFIKFVLKNI